MMQTPEFIEYMTDRKKRLEEGIVNTLRGLADLANHQADMVPHWKPGDPPAVQLDVLRIPFDQLVCTFSQLENLRDLLEVGNLEDVKGWEEIDPNERPKLLDMKAEEINRDEAIAIIKHIVDRAKTSNDDTDTAIFLIQDVSKIFEPRPPKAEGGAEAP
jgi:hypothetical protein